MTCFPGLKADTLLFVSEAHKGTIPQSLQWIRSKQFTEIEKLRVAIDKIHKHAGGRVKSQRDEERETRKKKDVVHTANFDVGDFVLIANREFLKG